MLAVTWWDLLLLLCLVARLPVLEKGMSFEESHVTSFPRSFCKHKHSADVLKFCDFCGLSLLKSFVYQKQNTPRQYNNNNNKKKAQLEKHRSAEREVMSSSPGATNNQGKGPGNEVDNQGLKITEKIMASAND